MTVAMVKALICFCALKYNVSPSLALEVAKLESDYGAAAMGDNGKAGVGMLERVFWGMIGFSTSLSGYLAAIQRSNMR